MVKPDVYDWVFVFCVLGAGIFFWVSVVQIVRTLVPLL